MFRLAASVALRRAPTALTAQNAALVRPAISFASVRLFSDEAGGAAAGGKSTGSVKWFDVKKGFGFIVPDDGSDDVFVHHSCVHADGFRSLADGEDVEFEIVEEGNGRRRAEGVTGPDGAAVQGAPRRFEERGGYGYGGGEGGGYGGGGGGYGGEGDRY
mmetsp:Transcript_14185/g.41621  ORF Transcript_14185/g.41621 Transcript_14185/m.41621 type:complete len:159 (-) Transcript_14185:457-933(-)|eukprot:CAMPEP_0113548618 /NCGR_PEP_ID=MMETSP0015_2-20120614/12989_1 /TAXON_ID=2838 /ORGANISM="Odontella" /LENGTH=158 /DNA_ID=CAMNT_0000449259 /DNA_START=126 /DNA_END=602 /DNA_ORIENTATION=+ /assembly_acc=CAM_ASM_000160